MQFYDYYNQPYLLKEYYYSTKELHHHWDPQYAVTSKTNHVNSILWRDKEKNMYFYVNVK